MMLLSGWTAAVEQFRSLWWLMLPLAAGFGIQVGLFSLIKSTIKTKSSIAAGGTSAGIGMLACCSHHVTDVLPLIGLSGVSIFLLRYQIPILSISIGINLIGIFIMLKHLKMVSL